MVVSFKKYKKIGNAVITGKLPSVFICRRQLKICLAYGKLMNIISGMEGLFVRDGGWGGGTQG